MNQEELNEVLRKHKMWINEEEGGERADLRWANLQRAYLKGANLKGANLKGANLWGANLQWTDIRGVNLEGADLQEADLQEADLQEADLQEADLRRANLDGANLHKADLDFSSLPLWCGSFGMKVDWNIFSQVLYHVCRLDCDDERAQKVIELVREYANQAPVRKRHGLPEIGEVEE